MKWVGNMACMGERKDEYRVLVENLRERDHLEDPCIEGRILLKWIFLKWEGDMGWIELAQNRDRWWDLVNVVMNLQVP